MRSSPARACPAAAPRTGGHGYNPAAFPAIYQATGLPTGANVTIGIITYGSDLPQAISDLAQYASANGFPNPPTQIVQSGGTGNIAGGLVEWDLDSQAILGAAGGHVGKLVFYNSPDFTQPAVIASLNRAVSDNAAKIVSGSLGGCEGDSLDPDFGEPTDEVLAMAAAQGQTFAFATGDAGADACGLGRPTASWPASSPYAVAVGGTSLSTTSGNAWSAETVWTSAGGAPSAFEPKPPWQAVFVTGSLRGTPDIAFDADPQTGAQIIVNGFTETWGGTSLATPLFAGLWARVIAAKGSGVGFATPLLYALPAGDFHDVVAGNNNGETAKAGYDLASGRGSVIFANAIGHIPAGPPASSVAASFNATATGLSVQFRDTSTDAGGTLSKHAWMFGDATTSTAVNPKHVYPNPGAFDVVEVVRDDLGSSAVAKRSLALGSQQLLKNPGFETGTASPWGISAGVLRNDPAQAHSGSWYAAIGLGGTGAHTDHVSQWVAIPAGVHQAFLSYYLRVTSAESPNASTDLLWVNLYDESNQRLEQIALHANNMSGSPWVPWQDDLTRYAGRRIRIEFQGINTKTFPTEWDLDDVSVWVQ